MENLQRKFRKVNRIIISSSKIGNNQIDIWKKGEITYVKYQFEWLRWEICKLVCVPIWMDHRHSIFDIRKAQ